MLRLELSIEDVINKYGKDKEILVCMHYPPITKNMQNSGFIEIMKKYNVKKCIYGHLHSASINDAVEGDISGIDCKLVSADGIDFELIEVQ